MSILEDIRQWIKDTELGRQLGQMPERMASLKNALLSWRPNSNPRPAAVAKVVVN
jgi:hypothetical protein